MLNPERVSDVFGPDVESTPTAHNALHREAPRCIWGDVLPHPSSSHLSWHRELVEREGEREGRDADEEVDSQNVTQRTPFHNPQHGLIQGL